MALSCSAAQPMRFIYKDKILRMTHQHIEIILSLQFHKRDSMVEFTFIEHFMIIRVSDTIYKLIDMPIRRQESLLLDEESKVDDDIKNI